MDEAQGSTDQWLRKTCCLVTGRRVIRHSNGYFLGGSDGKASAYSVGRPGFNPWVRKIPWRRKWQPTPILLPEKSHGWRSLVGYSPWGHKESDTTERLHFTSLPRAVLMLLCYIRTLWVQCTGIFLVNSFPTSDFGFTHLFNFCSSFFSLYFQAYLSPVIICWQSSEKVK